MWKTTSEALFTSTTLRIKKLAEANNCNLPIKISLHEFSIFYIVELIVMNKQNMDVMLG
jgi:hypothetical protein